MGLILNTEMVEEACPVLVELVTASSVLTTLMTAVDVCPCPLSLHHMHGDTSPACTSTSMQILSLHVIPGVFKTADFATPDLSQDFLQ